MIRKQIDKYLNLTKEITLSDFRLKYQGSVLGIVWSLIKPFFTFFIYYLVFTHFIKIQIERYAIQLLLGVIFWTFFSDATTLSLLGLQQKAPLIKKILFPRSVLVVSSTLIAFINLIIGMLILFIFYIVSEPGFNISNFGVFLFIIPLYLFSLGISLLICAYSAKFKDVIHIWDLTLKLGFWLTPITYSISMVPEKYRIFINLNPITYLLKFSKNVLIFGKYPSRFETLMLTFIVLLFFVAGIYIYKKRSLNFAEEL